MKHIIAWLGLKMDCAYSVDMDDYRETEEESRAAGKSNFGFNCSYVSQEYKMSFDYVEELYSREYLYRDEIDPRWELSGLAGSSNLKECLPGVIRLKIGENDQPYRALLCLLRALPGSVYEANLLEFMFEHNEANGRAEVRRRWSELWR